MKRKILLTAQKAEYAGGENSKAAEIRRQIRDELGARLAASRDEALRKQAADGITDLMSSVTLVKKDVVAAIGVFAKGCRKGIPKLSDYTESLIARIFTTKTVLHYVPWVFFDRPDDEILALGDFRTDDDYIHKFTFDIGTKGDMKEHGDAYRKQRELFTAYFKLMNAAAAYAKSIGAEDAAMAYIDAVVMMHEIAGWRERRRAESFGTDEMVERLFTQADSAHRLLYRRWLYHNLPPVDRIAAIADNGKPDLEG